MSAPTSSYDQIGGAYSRHRRADPRIAVRIHRALGDSRTVLNVGAGTGSYEPPGLRVTALEPSAVMVAQRQHGAAPAVRGVSQALPFPDGAFDAAMAILTLHHWPDKEAGLAEMCRVASRRVVLTFDVAFEHSFWLVRDYLPEMADLHYGIPLSAKDVADAVGARTIDVVPVPYDCEDGFLCAYWRRPECYLDPSVQACISGIARLDEAVVERGMARLAADLASGTWAERHADLLERTQMDCGYRLVIAG